MSPPQCYLIRVMGSLVIDIRRKKLPLTKFNSLYTSIDSVLLFKHRHAFATLSFVAEIFIFLYVGMDALDIDKWKASSAR